MKKLFLVLVAFTLSIFVSGCKPQISIKATGADDVYVNFSTGFAQETAKILKSMAGVPDSGSLFSEKDLQSMLKQMGAENPKASVPSPLSVQAEGKIPQISLFSAGISPVISRKEKSVSFTLGPEQFKSIYSALSEEYKSYFDLLMIPSLIDEKMSVQEYEELLSSMYGPTFAHDLINGEIELTLKSPDEKKLLREKISLGEVLTMTDEKIWSLSF